MIYKLRKYFTPKKFRSTNKTFTALRCSKRGWRNPLEKIGSVSSFFHREFYKNDSNRKAAKCWSIIQGGDELHCCNDNAGMRLVFFRLPTVRTSWKKWIICEFFEWNLLTCAALNLSPLRSQGYFFKTNFDMLEFTHIKRKTDNF